MEYATINTRIVYDGFDKSGFGAPYFTLESINVCRIFLEAKVVDVF